MRVLTNSSKNLSFESLKEKLHEIMDGITSFLFQTTDFMVVGDASAGPFTVTLPEASKVKGQFFIIKKIDSSANIITIVGAN